MGETMESTQSKAGRALLIASVLASLGYYLARNAALPAPALIAWKGACVGLLAAYALAAGGSAAHRTIAGVMALGALGDVLIEVSLTYGALAFFAGHVLAITLYLRHRRETMPMSQRLTAAALLLLTPAIAWLLPADRGQAPGIAIYALAVGGMACAAWASAFPRYRVGIGAVLFVVSDLLIFAGMGPLADSPLPGLLIWPLYYLGQLLICLGVIGALRAKETAA
ncbi:MAG: lysoplasmalogenase family protein [Novosphingobium sp.]